MRKLPWIVACGLFFACSADLCQTPVKVKWGPWQYTNYIVAGIVFRSKCMSSSDADSKWEYQFRNRCDGTVDFAARAEHGLDDPQKNDFGKPEMYTLDAGALSPVIETQLHGTCTEIRELKIEVLCVTVPGLDPPCSSQHPGGAQTEHKHVPDNPRDE